MTVDVFVAFILLTLAYLGWRTGALGQLLRIVAALAVLFGGRVAAQLVRDVLFAQSQWSGSVVADVAAYFLAVTLLYTSILAVGWLVIRMMRSASPTLGSLDRAGGAGIGALKAAVLAYVILWGCLLLAGPMERLDPEDRLHLRDGYATRWAEEADLLSPWRLPELEELHRMVEVGAAAREHDAQELVRSFGKAADLLRRDDVRELVGDEELVEAARDNRWAQTLGDPRVRELLGDESFIDAMRAVDWSKILEAVGPAEPTEVVDVEADER